MDLQEITLPNKSLYVNILSEIWKSVNVKNYPVKTSSKTSDVDSRTTRSISIGTLMESKILNASEKTFLNYAIHIWNKAPKEIKECSTFSQAKKAIKAFVISLPV